MNNEYSLAHQTRHFNSMHYYLFIYHLDDLDLDDTETMSDHYHKIEMSWWSWSQIEMEEWKNGRLEECKNVKDWKIWLEKCKIGRV